MFCSDDMTRRYKKTHKWVCVGAGVRQGGKSQIFICFNEILFRKLKYITQLISLNFSKLHNLYISIQEKVFTCFKVCRSLIHIFDVPCHDLNIFVLVCQVFFTYVHQNFSHAFSFGKCCWFWRGFCLSNFYSFHHNPQMPKYSSPGTYLSIQKSAFVHPNLSYKAVCLRFFFFLLCSNNHVLFFRVCFRSRVVVVVEYKG